MLCVCVWGGASGMARRLVETTNTNLSKWWGSELADFDERDYTVHEDFMKVGGTLIGRSECAGAVCVFLCLGLCFCMCFYREFVLARLSAMAS